MTGIAKPLPCPQVLVIMAILGGLATVTGTALQFLLFTIPRQTP
jgi:hypothetical protein